MKITIEHYNEKFTFETDKDGLGLDDLHDIWKRCLLAMTFSEKVIDEYYDIHHN